MFIDRYRYSRHDITVGIDHMINDTSNIGAYMLLLETGVAYIANLDLDHVGVHSRNREGQMLIISNVRKLIKMMMTDGYNPALIKCLAVEVSPSKIEAQRDANARLWERADGMLAKSNKSNLKVFTLMGSHTTAVFRILKYGAIVDDPRYADASGNLQRGKLFDAQPSLKIPVESGLP